MIHPEIVNKYNQIVSDRSDINQFLTFLKSLSQDEWDEIIEQTLLEGDFPYEISVLDKEGSSLSNYIAYFKRLGIPYISTIGLSIERFFNKLNLATDSNNEGLERALRVVSSLKEGLRPDLLISLLKRHEDPEIKELAIMALSNYHNPLSITFWLNLDLEGQSYLAPYVINALRKANSRLALEAFFKIPVALDQNNIRKLEYPTKLATRQFLNEESEGGIKSLKRLIDKMPGWAQSYFNSYILKLGEFKPFIEDSNDKNNSNEHTSYALEELYIDGDKEFREVNLESPKTQIPDHQTLQFAAFKNYFKEVGINISFNANILHPDIPKTAFNTANGDALISMPWELIKNEPYANKASDIVLINLFKGFSLIGRRNSKYNPLDINDPKLLNNFYDLTRAMMANFQKIGCLDQGGRDFVYLMENLTNRTQNVSGGCVRDTTPPTYGKDTLFEKLKNEEDYFIIGSASTTALALQEGKYQSYLTSDIMERVIELIAAESQNPEYERQKKNFLRKTYLINSWNINIPINQWDLELNKALILRLASVAWRTIDYYHNNKLEVIDFILKNWNESHPGQEINNEFMSMLFEESYEFEPFENMSNAFFKEGALYRYELNEGESNSQRVYSNLLMLKNDSEGIIKKLEEIKTGKYLSEDTLTHIKRYEERARRHFKNKNFYDSHRYFKKAQDDALAA